MKAIRRRWPGLLMALILMLLSLLILTRPLLRWLSTARLILFPSQSYTEQIEGYERLYQRGQYDELYQLLLEADLQDEAAFKDYADAWYLALERSRFEERRRQISEQIQGAEAFQVVELIQSDDFLLFYREAKRIMSASFERLDRSTLNQKNEELLFQMQQEVETYAREKLHFPEEDVERMRLQRDVGDSVLRLYLQELSERIRLAWR